LDPAFGPTYAYAPSLNVSIELESNNRGGVSLFAVDGTVTNPDDEAGLLYDSVPSSQTLWLLTMDATGPVSSSGQVAYNFAVNPLALDEIALPPSYLTSRPWYHVGMSDTEIAFHFSEDVESAISTSMTVSGGRVALTNFAPFPGGTTY
jgi:hypothetical protein